MACFARMFHISLSLPYLTLPLGSTFVTKQVLLKIDLPQGTRVYISDFREYVAKAMGQLPACPELFHYVNPGQTAPNMPRTRFVGGKRWLGILTDEANENVLYTAMGPAVQAIQHLCGRVTPIYIERVELKLTPVFHPSRRYWVREMAIKQRSRRKREMDPVELVSQEILTGLKRQAEAYGLAWPGDDKIGLDRVVVEKARGLALRTTEGVTGEYVGLFDASFSLNASLEGYWLVGNLTSRGYGRIGLNLADLAVNYILEERLKRRAA